MHGCINNRSFTEILLIAPVKDNNSHRFFIFCKKKLYCLMNWLSKCNQKMNWLSKRFGPLSITYRENLTLMRG